MSKGHIVAYSRVKDKDKLQQFFGSATLAIRKYVLESVDVALGEAFYDQIVK